MGDAMTNETIKALLMILIIGGLQAAIHIPKMRLSRTWAFLAAHFRSTISLTDPPLQPALVKSKSRNRQFLR